MFTPIKKLVTIVCYDKRHVSAYLQPFSHYKSELRQNNVFFKGGKDNSFWRPRSIGTLRPKGTKFCQ